MQAENIKSSLVFARNPIIVRGTWPEGAFDPRGGSYVVTAGGHKVYEGRFSPSPGVNLSEIAETVAGRYPDVRPGKTPLVSFAADEMQSRSVTVDFRYDEVEQYWTATVVPGGVSRRQFRRWAEAGTDAFEARFLNPTCNFFLTSRTSGRTLTVRETELYPLYFLIVKGTMRVTSPAAPGAFLEYDLEYDLDGNYAGFHALDVAALRRQFALRHGALASVFDISVGGLRSCRVVIEHADTARDRHLLKFRNSLGVPELFEATGTLKEVYTADETEYPDRYDTVADSYDREPPRRRMRRVWKLDTGPRRPEDLRFMLDMLASDEVWLTGADGGDVRVIPDIGDLSLAARQDAPESVTLTLEECGDETEYYPGQETSGRRRRIFSQVFDNHFN